MPAAAHYLLQSASLLFSFWKKMDRDRKGKVLMQQSASPTNHD